MAVFLSFVVALCERTISYHLFGLTASHFTFVRIVIDLNDGVRLNIRPFFEAGVLREKAQKLYIKWGKTAARTSPPPRGTPSCINDHHITLAEKAAAREVK